jgi:hypothetical protein
MGRSGCLHIVATHAVADGAARQVWGGAAGEAGSQGEAGAARDVHDGDAHSAHAGAG